MHCVGNDQTRVCGASIKMSYQNESNELTQDLKLQKGDKAKVREIIGAFNRREIMGYLKI